MSTRWYRCALVCALVASLWTVGATANAQNVLPKAPQSPPGQGAACSSSGWAADLVACELQQGVDRDLAFVQCLGEEGIVSEEAVVDALLNCWGHSLVDLLEQGKSCNVHLAACPANQVCIDDHCVERCPPGTTACESGGGGVCFTNPPCEGGSIDPKTCACVCASTASFCGGACVSCGSNAVLDPSTCTCACSRTTCAADETLDTTTCQCVKTCQSACPPGQIQNPSTCECGCGSASCSGACCAGVCVDTQKDTSNCSSCGVVCPAGQACQSGACAPSPPPPEPQSCARPCPTGQTCQGGTCAPPPPTIPCPTGRTCCGYVSGFGPLTCMSGFTCCHCAAWADGSRPAADLVGQLPQDCIPLCGYVLGDTICN